MWQWVICNAAGIQAIASAIAAVFAIIGFIFLVKYASDTRIIAHATSVQAKDNVMPFLALLLVPSSQDAAVMQWKVQNQGFGPAINIKHWLPHDSMPWQRPSIMQGTDALIYNNVGEQGLRFAESLKTSGGFSIEYDSIAGEHLRSTFRIVSAQQVDVNFENLSRRKSKDTPAAAQ